MASNTAAWVHQASWGCGDTFRLRPPDPHYSWHPCKLGSAQLVLMKRPARLLPPEERLPAGRLPLPSGSWLHFWCLSAPSSAGGCGVRASGRWGQPVTEPQFPGSTFPGAGAGAARGGRIQASPRRRRAASSPGASRKEEGGEDGFHFRLLAGTTSPQNILE